MARSPDFVFNYLEEIEGLAEDILTDKQQIVDLDKRRNMNREALRAIKKETVAPVRSNDKVWVNCGNMFIKFNKETAVGTLEADQKVIDNEIDNLRTGLHKKVNRLQDAEGKDEVQGYDLKAMSQKELNALTH